MFVFSNFLCFQRHKNASSPGISAVVSGVHTNANEKTKFAIPMKSIVDASPNPGVYPFGALLVTIDGVKNPWLFSFFTEREDALRCIRGAIANLAERRANVAVTAAAALANAAEAGAVRLLTHST